MANLRAIRTRIKSVENTRQITKSMKMVAAAKLKRTQQAMNALRPYAAASGEMLASACADASVRGNPFLEKREKLSKKRIWIHSETSYIFKSLPLVTNR
jgi:F-type H+-transporting ATPase subunit gamma